MNTKDHGRDDISKLAKLIEDIPIAMLTTIEPDGKFRSRPMANQQTEFDGDLWFFTSEHTAKVEDIRRYPQVNVVYVSGKDSRYISVTGRAEIVHDPMKKNELWKPAFKAWFPRGLEDPDLALLKVAVERAEYWDSPSSYLVQLLNFSKIISGGRSKDSDVGEHKKLH